MDSYAPSILQAVRNAHNKVVEQLAVVEYTLESIGPRLDSIPLSPSVSD